MRTRWLVGLLLCSAASLPAQTAADSAHVRTVTPALTRLQDMFTRYCGTRRPLQYVCDETTSVVVIRNAEGSLVTAPIVTPPDTAKDSTVVVPSTGNIAALPQNAEVSDTLPSTPSSTSVPNGANLQTAINSAPCLSTLLLAPGATFTGNFVVPARGATCWLVIRTALPSRPTGRMTPSKAASLQLARIVSPNYSPSITTQQGASGLVLAELEITVAPTVSTTNMLIDFRGDPSRLIITSDWIHGQPTTDSRRGITLNARQCAVTHNWIGDVHSNNSDSQSLIGYDYTAECRIEDNHLEAGHEVVMFGGADPSDSSRSPRDLVIRGNHIMRPVAWKKVWQVKNLIESKNARRVLVEGNVIENEWADAQAGFALVLKSENQQGTAPWTTTSDWTIRYNLFRCVGNWLNVSGHGSNGTPNIVSSRITLYQNLVQQVNTPDCNASGIAAQVLTEMTDLNISRTTVLNDKSSQLMTFDGTPSVRLVFTDNVGYRGSYGVKGSGTADGSATLAKYAPGAVFTGNAIVGGGSCTQYPTGNTCPSTMPATPGADSTLVMAKVAGVVVTDPTLQRPRLANPRRLPYPWHPTPPSERDKSVGIEP